MGGQVKVNLSGLKKYQRDLQRLRAETDAFFEACAKELAARLIAKAVKRTPVGEGVFEVVRDENKSVVKKQRGKNKGKAKLQRLTNGGTFRRGWTAKTEEEAAQGRGSGQDAVSFVQTLNVERSGSEYRITVMNPVSYASYVEFGHRQTPGRYVPQIGKRLKKSWVAGQFILTLSSAELKKESPRILEKKIDAFLRGVLGG